MTTAAAVRPTTPDRALLATIALLLATAGGGAPTAPPPAVDPAPRKVAGHWLVAPAAVAVAASSAADGWHPVANVRDGDPATAWAPGPSDPAPALVLELGTRATVRDLGVKLVPAGTTVAVDAWTGAAWEPLAAGAAPPGDELGTIDLPDRATTRVRLTFGGMPPSDLEVAEVVLGADPPRHGD